MRERQHFEKGSHLLGAGQAAQLVCEGFALRLVGVAAEQVAAGFDAEPLKEKALRRRAEDARALRPCDAFKGGEFYMCREISLTRARQRLTLANLRVDWKLSPINVSAGP